MGLRPDRGRHRRRCQVTYATEEAAFRHAETIRLQGKWWPGVIRHRDGTFELTYDPTEVGAPDLERRLS